MKTIFGLLTVAFLTFSCTQNNNLTLGKKILDLSENPLNVDIPKFFSEEKNFDDQEDNDLFVEAEERRIQHEKGESTFMVYYNVTKNKKKLKLAKFGNLEFDNLELLTDLKDEKTFLIAASRDSLTTQSKDELLKAISLKFGEAEKSEDRYDSNNLRWEKGNVVVKVAVRSDSEDNFGGYYENEETENQDPAKPDQSVTIFILRKDFEKLVKNSYSGMGIFRDYF